MNSLSVLDVTLRDGGCVNNFNFGCVNMKKILSAQEKSGVDIIEVGYIDSLNGSEFGRTQFINEKVIKKTFIKQKKQGICYVAMIDFGKYDVNELSENDGNGIDGIRLAFHKKNRFDIIDVGRKIIEKGYKLFIQPMITMRYTDGELLEFIELINKKLADAAGFYIVDSFGEMRPNDMSRILNLVDHNLIKSMSLGFHSHNNLQMSYSNAISMLQFPTSRNYIIDSSIMGMGKGAGNLNTELLMEHLNIFYGKSYQIEPLLEVMDKIINQIRAEFYWGYAPEYYLSAANHCSPSYASYFYSKQMLPINQVGVLLSRIAEEKKISFDRNYAEELYLEFNKDALIDDRHVVSDLKGLFENKRMLLIAPGKSISKHKKEITDISRCNDVITIGVNTELEFNDYVITTRKEVYDSALKKGLEVIACSNISKVRSMNVRYLNYSNWIELGEEVHDSALIIALNVLEKCNVKEILMAGFDGFTLDINDNYYNANMRNTITSEQVRNRNKYYKEFIAKKRENLKILFVTESLYS